MCFGKCQSDRLLQSIKVNAEISVLTPKIYRAEFQQIHNVNITYCHIHNSILDQGMQFSSTSTLLLITITKTTTTTTTTNDKQNNQLTCC
jgi:hypothetical protein